MSFEFGMNRKILWVDLSARKLKEEKPDLNIYKSYLGGYGLGVYYLYKKMKESCDPLGLENILGFCPGLLTGTIAPFTGRHMVCAKSPLTGTWGDSNCGGYFGPAIKRAGYDAIFFKGISENPVYLSIDSSSIQLLSASEIWGKDVIQTEKILKKKHGNASLVEAIGVAGENQSLISGIVTDGGRIAARSGLGAVMGSKRLKALCLKGKRKPRYADRERLLALTKRYNEKVKRHGVSVTTAQAANLAPKMAKLYRILKMPTEGDDFMYGYTLHNYGTAFATALYAETGDMPIKNFKGIGYKDWPQDVAQDFTGHNIRKYRKKSYGCFGCPLKCGSILEVPEAGLEETHCPEYETLAAFGGMIVNPDVEEVILANHMLNIHGMDTISAGNIIAFVLECVERGILSKEDFKCKDEPEGFIPRWNESYHIYLLLKLMINREGIGDILADGVKVASERIGKGSESFAMHSKGQELPMHDGRYMQGLMLAYLVDPTPGRHTAGCLDFSSLGPVDKFMKGLDFKNAKDPEEKGYHNAKFVKFRQAFNALGLCEYALPQGNYPLLEIIESVTGWSLTIEDLLETGWRIQTLRQIFNAREHAISYDIPARALGKPPMREGPLKGKNVSISDMIKGYYDGMEFNKQGLPTTQLLEKLDLEFCISSLDSVEGASSEQISIR